MIMIKEGNERAKYKLRPIDMARLVRNNFRRQCFKIKFYSKCRFVRLRGKNIYYFIFKPNYKHPGLADRIKAIVSSYNIAKANGYKYKLYFETPFRLFDYLMPNYDMGVNLSDIDYSLFDTRLTRERYKENLIKLRPNKQYQCYEYEGHSMPRVFPNTGRRWCDVFHEMFRPSVKLEAAYKSLNIKEHTYVSCHLRFVNALEKFENTFFDNYISSEMDRQSLINRCKKGIQEILDENPNKDVYVFSDSKLFLDSLADIPVKVLPHDKIEHVSEGADDDSVLKTFLDLYVMSKGDAVYRFCAPELYSISHYALLAATIGDIPFYDQNV